MGWSNQSGHGVEKPTNQGIDQADDEPMRGKHFRSLGWLLLAARQSRETGNKFCWAQDLLASLSAGCQQEPADVT